MMLNGQTIAQKIYEEIGDRLRGKRVCFVSFLDSPESRVFMEKKQKIAEKLGITAEIRMVPTLVGTPAEVGEQAEQIVQEIAKSSYDGVVIQLPLPAEFDAQKLFDTLPVELDIDMLGTKAKEAYVEGKTKRVPPVAGATQEILQSQSVNLADRRVVVLGKGRLVGEPVALWFRSVSQTYKNFDINTQKSELLDGLKEADIVISGIGQPHFIKPDMVKSGVILIDAGTSEQAGKLAGDIDPACAEIASLYTPVPGGVGPITIAVLMRNLSYFE